MASDDVNDVLDENGSPVCTIGSIPSFHKLLAQLPGKDWAPDSPDCHQESDTL